MRLLNTTAVLDTTTPQLSQAPTQSWGSAVLRPYAILSHCWGRQDDEVTLQQLNDRTYRRESYGWQKIEAACRKAQERGLEWIWIDTCCIDKTSSAELSEAINSMYAWYSDAVECYAFLNDVPGFDAASSSTEQDFQRFRASRWFTRAWTSQELLAPKEVYFYAITGQVLTDIGRPCTREALRTQISRATNIDPVYLTRSQSIRSASIARRMSWASNRDATQEEDIAYSLLGLFDVTMPLIYGKGEERAFTRLQIHIIEQSTDDSVFAWAVDEGHSPLDGILARGRRAFAGSRDIFSTSDNGLAMSQATLYVVIHTSMMPIRMALATCLFGAYESARDTIRLRCIAHVHGKAPRTLRLSLERAKDGKCYRTALATRETTGLHSLWITLQQFVTYPKQVSVSSRSYNDNTGDDVPRSKYWWSSVPTSRLLWTLRALRFGAIMIVVAISVTGQTTCDAGTSSCDAAILVTVLVFMLRDLVLNRFQFWAVIVISLFMSLFMSGLVGFGIDQSRRA